MLRTLSIPGPEMLGPTRGRRGLPRLCQAYRATLARQNQQIALHRWQVGLADDAEEPGLVSLEINGGELPSLHVEVRHVVFDAGRVLGAVDAPDAQLYIVALIDYEGARLIAVGRGLPLAFHGLLEDIARAVQFAGGEGLLGYLGRAFVLQCGHEKGPFGRRRGIDLLLAGTSRCYAPNH